MKGVYKNMYVQNLILICMYIVYMKYCCIYLA